MFHFQLLLFTPHCYRPFDIKTFLLSVSGLFYFLYLVFHFAFNVPCRIVQNCLRHTSKLLTRNEEKNKNLNANNPRRGSKRRERMKNKIMLYLDFEMKISKSLLNETVKKTTFFLPEQHVHYPDSGWLKLGLKNCWHSQGSNLIWLLSCNNQYTMF